MICLQNLTYMRTTICPGKHYVRGIVTRERERVIQPNPSLSPSPLPQPWMDSDSTYSPLRESMLQSQLQAWTSSLVTSQMMVSEEVKMREHEDCV